MIINKKTLILCQGSRSACKKASNAGIRLWKQIFRKLNEARTDEELTKPQLKGLALGKSNQNKRFFAKANVYVKTVSGSERRQSHASLTRCA